MSQIVGRRPVLIGVAATLLASPAHSQKPPPRIGWLSAGSEPDPFLAAFREGLQKLGYVEGRNVVLDIRHAHGNLEALLAGATELAQSKVVLIVASLTAVRAARTAVRLATIRTTFDCANSVAPASSASKFPWACRISRTTFRPST